MAWRAARPGGEDADAVTAPGRCRDWHACRPWSRRHPRDAAGHDGQCQVQRLCRRLPEHVLCALVRLGRVLLLDGPQRLDAPVLAACPPRDRAADAGTMVALHSPLGLGHVQWYAGGLCAGGRAHRHPLTATCAVPVTATHARGSCQTPSTRRASTPRASCWRSFRRCSRPFATRASFCFG